MKRIHLFEFEDLHWFPNWLRVCMTRYINAIHKLLNSSNQIAEILAGFFTVSKERHILDLCSGSGGPMPEVLKLLNTNYGINDIRLTLSDLYPNLVMAEKINLRKIPSLSYLTTPVDVTRLETAASGVRSLICSFHHMSPAAAKSILKSAMEAGEPIFIYEISDNSFPKWLWWIGLPINVISVLLITPLVRPMSWQQLVFTYLIPILPLVIAWDGAISNARTYTLEDFNILLEGLDSKNYRWEKSTVKGKGGNKLYLMGSPIHH